MTREVEPIDLFAVRAVIALRAAGFTGIAVRQAVLTVGKLIVLARLRAAAQLLDLRLCIGKVAARALELEGQNDHRDEEHQRKRQKPHKKRVKRIAPRLAAADPTSFHK